MHVIDIRRSRYDSVGKQESQAITVRNSKVRVVIRRNLRHKTSDVGLEKGKGYHKREQVDSESNWFG